MESIIRKPSASGTGLDDVDEQTLADSGFFWREKDGVRILVCSDLEGAGFANGFSTRLGGVSPFPEGDLNLAGYDEDLAENIEENRRRFLAVFETGYRLSTVWQVHGDSIKVVSSEAEASATEERHDGIISNLPHLLIGVKTADCVPILIGDTETGAFAAVHAGWRGSASSIAVKAVGKMKDVFGSRPDDLIAAIGPAASCSNYEIGAEVLEAFAGFPNAESYFTPTRDGHALVDLLAVNRDQLLDAGLGRDRIKISPFCTMERTDLFFSYRIEKKQYGRTGRLLSVIGKAELSS